MMTPDQPSALDYGAMAMGLAGGLALFLFGMRNLTESLSTVAGDRMKRVLGKLTTNRFTGAVAGALVTAVIQSSSITTVLVVGFVSAGLMSLSQSIGVILGANIGTTITAQIIAFKVTKYALAIIAVGFLTELVTKRPIFRHYGSMIVGLGLLFLGMEFMSEAMSPLRSYTPSLEIMQGMQNPLYGIVIGAVFTALVQSSSATTGIVIVLASQGLIPLEAGIALIFGSNIGTCVTALLSSIGKPREALQTALVHVIFNFAGVMLWVLFIPQFADLVRGFSPASEHLEGLARLAADAPRQIANAHTLFNVGNALIFIWFAPWMGTLAVKLIPEKADERDRHRAAHLDPYYLETPPAALDQVKLELERLGQIGVSMARQGLPTAVKGPEPMLASLEDMDDDVDALHGQILAFLAKLSERDLSDRQPDTILDYISVANYIENLGDVVESGFVQDGRTRIAQDIRVSPETGRRLEKLHADACTAIEAAVGLISKPDSEAARGIIQSKEELDEQVAAIRAHLARRMASDEPLRIETFRLETNLLENTKTIHALARRIARATLRLNERSRDS